VIALAAVPESKVQDPSIRREEDLILNLEAVEREKKALQSELLHLRQDLCERDAELLRVSGNAEKERRVWDEVGSVS
jgi:hypothetical protein